VLEKAHLSSAARVRPDPVMATTANVEQVARVVLAATAAHLYVVSVCCPSRTYGRDSRLTLTARALPDRLLRFSQLGRVGDTADQWCAALEG